MYVFIGGPPTSGKTHLATEFISYSNKDILHVKLDDFRNELKVHPVFGKWVELFSNQDATKYWQENTPKDHIKNIIIQAKALWPGILKKMMQKKDTHENIIFEGVSILPEFARKYIDFPGFYLIPTDVESIYNRLLAHHRWGKTNELKRKEAIAFYEEGQNLFKQSANEFGYKVFEDFDEALSRLSIIFK